MGASNSITQQTIASVAKLNIATEKESYVAGETIKGYVQAEILSHDTDISSLTVVLHAEAKTTVRYRYKEGHGKEAKHKSATARSTVTLVKVDVVVAKFDASTKPAAGAYQYPFTMQVPPNAPSSMPLFKSGMNSAMITYTLKVIASRSGGMGGSIAAKFKPTLCHQIPIDILSAAPENAMEQGNREEGNAKVTMCCCIGQGDMSVAARSSLRAFKGGDNPSILCELSINSQWP